MKLDFNKLKENRCSYCGGNCPSIGSCPVFIATILSNNE